MSLIISVRNQLIQHLWQSYIHGYSKADLQKILQNLAPNKPILDHFALIDLPGLYCGIGFLNQIFAALEYYPQGRDYLADKQNEFMWLAPVEAPSQKATEAHPQVVIADFCLEDMPSDIREIIYSYGKRARPFPWREFHALCGRVYHDDEQAAQTLSQMLVGFFSDRAWPLPTVHEYQQVFEYNELLAWVLAFGRTVNHFGIAIQHLDHAKFPDLAGFNDFIAHDLDLPLNPRGGLIKGGVTNGIAQSGIESAKVLLALQDGSINITGPFMEFVWRFLLPEAEAAGKNPALWSSYFTGLVGRQANYVVESVYNT